ncbi:unnamed protein product [Microthlaspi erraticum]|uniref:F-box domain-containing protein n=1 Tax=Microthlaspi erraticum TaxID=1685480 RepID=A0A6D2J613_9BRAS|nr:unnamed protein product [Microthlaspi erraticum]CAA7061193.1 unnamed protein product [Microthlaspi erraticum]
MRRGSNENQQKHKSSRQDRGGDKSSDTTYIPWDIVTVDILSRLPLKSVARFRCVSKLWSSLINEWIKTRATTQPRLLAIMLQSSSFSSYTYPLSSNNKAFIPADKGSHTSSTSGLIMSRYVHGLICCWSNSDRFRIYNPTSGQSVLLPKIKYDGLRNLVNGFFETNLMNGFFGYDPVENQYKVLCFTRPYWECSCQVFTLGGPKKLEQWRSIITDNFLRPDDDILAAPWEHSTSVCINGFIYYTGRIIISALGRFDVRFERFDRIQMPPDTRIMNQFWDSTLVNYQGKLGCVRYKTNGSAEMWIMEEDDHLKKQEWSKIALFMMPLDLANTFRYMTIITGVTRDGEIVITPKTLRSDESLYAYFCDPMQYKTRRVEFERPLSWGSQSTIFSVPDHMEITTTMSLFGNQFKKNPETTLGIMYDAVFSGDNCFLCPKKLLYWLYPFFVRR